MKKTLLFGMMLVCSALFMNVSAATPGVDDSTYVARVDGKFTFQNKWIYSFNEGNYNVLADWLGAAGSSRGMTSKDGKILFSSRTSTNQILVIDGATGTKLAPIPLASNVFTYLGRNKANTADSTWTAPLPNNDIQKDNAGNILVSNLITSNTGRFQVWQINLADGSGKVLVDTDIKTHYPLSVSATRFDAFGVWGDVTNNAVIMAANAEATVTEVYKWTITGGVVNQKPTLIELDNSGQFWFGAYTAATNSFAPLANLGSAPRVLPLDDNYFYVDGNTTFPTVCDKDGNVIDGFYKLYNTDGTTKDAKAYAALTDSITTPGKKMVMNVGHNGLAEFSLGGEDFLVMAATNTAGSPSSSFRILKFADAAKAFSGLTQMWTFPKNGMGTSTNSNAYRTGMPSVEISADGTTANIYVYTGEVGYAMYEMKYVPTGLSRTQVSDVTITLNNNKILISESVKSAEVYSISGMRLAFANNVSEIAAPTQKGIYLVSIVDNSGAKKVQKVAVH